VTKKLIGCGGAWAARTAAEPSRVVAIAERIILPFMIEPPLVIAAILAVGAQKKKVELVQTF
jgi:hypothetical protein